MTANTRVNDPDFSLLDDPWIAVRLLDGSDPELSIRDVFRRAHEIRDIAGELPTQDFAVLRLLLAILYRALGPDITPDAWYAWRERGLPLTRIEEYLDRFADRFRLFDPSRPFFQVADLATAKGEFKDVAPLIFDLPSNNRLFTNRSGDGVTSLSPGEAARWLVNAQAFDASGIKSGALGDDRVKGGKGYPIGIAWTGHLGGIYAVESTLRGTLLLNLVGAGNGFSLSAGDLPPWEEADPDTAAERWDLVPRGPVRLFTWQSRRIRLFARDGRVTGCLVANGDKLTPQNMHVREPLTAWRYSEPQTKAAKQTTYMPREHIPGRALWRGVSALLPGISQNVPKKDVSVSLPPPLIGWLDELRDNEYLADGDRVLLRAVGVVYGSNNSVVDEVLFDELLLPYALLSESNRALALVAQDAVALAEEGARAIRQLAENLARAAGGDGEWPGIRARDRAYALLDAPYREWLATLTPDKKPLDATDEWKATARRVLARLGDELVDAAGPAAWIGREVSRLGASTLVTASRADSWFRGSLTKTFGTSAGKVEAA